MAQTKNSFDKATLKKVFIGALIAGGGSMALFILNWIGTIEFSNPTLALAVSLFVPVAINAVKEFIKGE